MQFRNLASGGGERDRGREGGRGRDREREGGRKRETETERGREIFRSAPPLTTTAQSGVFCSDLNGVVQGFSNYQKKEGGEAGKCP